jgi:hypothetical protein
MLPNTQCSWAIFYKFPSFSALLNEQRKDPTTKKTSIWHSQTHKYTPPTVHFLKANSDFLAFHLTCTPFSSIPCFHCKGLYIVQCRLKVSWSGQTPQSWERKLWMKRVLGLLRFFEVLYWVLLCPKERYFHDFQRQNARWARKLTYTFLPHL